MKFRTGFVSNSSSSSFVIAMPKGESEIVIKVNLKDYADEALTTVKAVDRYFAEKRSLDLTNPNDWDYKNWSKARAAVEKGLVIYVGWFSDQEGGLEAGLCNEGITNNNLPEGGIVIESEGGY